MHYQELYIFPDPETPRHILRERVFLGLHLAFVETEKALSGSTEIDSSRFGVSFPNYNADFFELDYTIRIFAPTEKDLNELNLDQKLKKVKDYLRLSQISPVPETKVFASYKRKQVKSGLERLARRQVKRGNFPNEEIALETLKKKERKKSKLPYVYVTTSSTGKHRLPLFIDQVTSDTPAAQTFTTYGLSKDGSTVPIF